MTVWVLKERDEADQEEWATARDIFYSPYSHSHGFVVVAATEEEARAVARQEEDVVGERWLDTAVTSCEPIADNGEARVVLGDWPTG